jgi:hypothetical protein
LFFRGSAFEGHTIEEQLAACGAEHQAVVGTSGNCAAQFAPGDVHLLRGAGVIETV